MLSSIKIIVLSSSLITTPKAEPKPIVIEQNYSIEAAKYLKSKQQDATIDSKINDLMYREILKQIEFEQEN